MDLAAKDEAGKKLRRNTWTSVDPNGNGLVSLAEADGWIQKYLMLEYGNDIGKDIWKAFRPSYIRAFNDAKDVADSVSKGKINTDDYVSKAEFRILAAYLCL